MAGDSRRSIDVSRRHFHPYGLLASRRRLIANQQRWAWADLRVACRPPIYPPQTCWRTRRPLLPFRRPCERAPGSGDRPRSAIAEEARADLRRALKTGEPVDDEIIERLVLPLVEKAVPEWRATLDALLSLPEIGGPVGYAGGVIAIGMWLAAVEPRISAALLFAGSFVPRVMFEDARQVTIPLQVLLQWDDEGNDRQLALDLFDAFGSNKKTLHANMGGHTGVPQFEGDDGNRFFARHLK